MYKLTHNEHLYTCTCTHLHMYTHAIASKPMYTQANANTQLSHIILHQRIKLVKLKINHNINLISDQSFIKPIYVSIEGYVLTSVLV